MRRNTQSGVTLTCTPALIFQCGKRVLVGLANNNAYLHLALVLLLDCTTAYVLKLLDTLFHPRGKGKMSLLTTFEVKCMLRLYNITIYWYTCTLHCDDHLCTCLFCFQGESINVVECLETIACKAPFIAAFGISLDELLDIKLVVEGENRLEMPSLAIALHCCFALYYLFHISFTPELSPILLFLEQYVHHLKPTKKPPVSVCVVADCIPIGP